MADGAERRELESEIRPQRPLTKKIRLLGAIYDEQSLAPWLLSSEFLLHPNAIGLSLCHAFGYGLPVITHDNAANQMPEYSIFRHMKNGIGFPEGDAEGMTLAMNRLLTDPQLRAEMSSNALRAVQNEFNTSVMAHRTKVLLSRVLAN